MKFFRAMVMAGVMLVSHATMAQLKMDLGVKAGFNYYGLDLSSAGKLGTTNYNSGAGFHVGGYALIKVSKLAVQPELVFSRQGQYFSTPYNSNLSTTLYYINIPVMVKYYVVGGLNVQVGPQLGILASSKGDLVNKGLSQGLVASGQSLKDYVNPIDFSVAFGAGLDLPFGASLTVRYNLGLTDVNKYTDGTVPGTSTPSISTSSAKNQVIQISLGYRLKKIGK
jgi:hypothetical protein